MPSSWLHPILPAARTLAFYPDPRRISSVAPRGVTSRSQRRLRRAIMTPTLPPHCLQACRLLQSREFSQTAVRVSMKTKSRNKRVRLILNGKVAANAALKAAVARQRAAGHRIEVRVTGRRRCEAICVGSRQSGLSGCCGWGRHTE